MSTTPSSHAFPLSVLDLAPVSEGSDVREALRNTLDLARHAERWGYRRYWIAEHHGMPGVAGAATAVVIGHVAAGTHTIRVGAGGIMLPNHPPLVIAEQFGTLEALHPGRIDLGLGRAPGTDFRTAQALRRDPTAADSFPQDVQELQAWLAPAEPGQAVRAVPGEGQDIPLYLLGSSLFSARLAAQLGLPFAFASHFAPDWLMPALDLYRTEFRPSAALAAPYAMGGIQVVAADTDAEAERLFTSVEQQFLAMQRGRPGKLQPPVAAMAEHWSPQEQVAAARMLRLAVTGGPATVRDALADFVARTGVDELLVTSHVFEHAARLRSYEIVASVAGALERSPEGPPALARATTLA